MNIETRGRDQDHAQETCEKAVERLVETDLADDHSVKVVSFIDGVLVLASELGHLNCQQAVDRRILFRTRGQLLAGMELTKAKGKLRMLCARLATVCRERSGKPVSPYGDETDLEYEISPQQRIHLKVRFVNTADHQEFDIEARPA